MPLAWSWLCAPYVVCALSLAAVGLAAALVRGDRVLRLGSIGASTAALPWAVCSALAACTPDANLAARLLRLGNGPIALVGPCLLLVLLGVSGQLERHRRLARLAGLAGSMLTAACWAAPWTVAGVRELPSGMFYPVPGPLSGLHFSQIAIWLGIGIAIGRRSTWGGARRNLRRMIVAVFALCSVGATDLLLVYDIAGVYPISWLCATVAAAVGLYFELRSDLLRPQGLDRGVARELAGFAIAIAAVTALVLALGTGAPVAVAVAGSLVWVIALGVAWARTNARPAGIARERALEQFVAALADVDRETVIADRLTALWRELAIDVRAMLRVEGDRLEDIATGAARALDREVAAWLVRHGELLAAADLGTMRVGPIRPKLEALLDFAGGAPTALGVPLIDRGILVGVALADRDAALREDERGHVVESARAAARAMTYAGLARAAAKERETAHEVEVAEAMRRSASASRDDELGPWTVVAEYRTAARTTGAGWSANLLADGRLAVLVTEAQAHGVAAALATAALTGAFAAATTGARAVGAGLVDNTALPFGGAASPGGAGLVDNTALPFGSAASPGGAGLVDLDDLLTSLGASADGAARGGEPVAVFLAILDPEAQTIAWASAGHPGGAIASPSASPIILGTGTLGAKGSLRGEAAFRGDALLVIASTGVQGDDEARWHRALRDHAPAGARFAALLVETALRTGPAHEDLLAVVVRRR